MNGNCSWAAFRIARSVTFTEWAGPPFVASVMDRHTVAEAVTELAKTVRHVHPKALRIPLLRVTVLSTLDFPVGAAKQRL